jgi:hypothetical protein
MVVDGSHRSSCLIHLLFFFLFNRRQGIVDITAKMWLGWRNYEKI